MYYLLRLAEIVIPRLPRFLVYRLGGVIAFAAWLLAARARRQANENMMHVLGGQDEQARQFLHTRSGHKRLRKVVRGMFRQNVSNYLDLFLLPSLKPETILQSMEVRGFEHVQQALASGKGVIIYSAHLGPFDYLIQWLAIQGYAVTVPVEHLADQRILDLILRLRRCKGVQYVPLGGSAAMRAMLQTLRKNQVVLMTADRAVHGESVTVPFFGAPARLPSGIAQLAVRTGAPLVGAFGWRTRSTPVLSQVAQIMPVSLALPQEQRQQIEPLMQRIVSSMEQYIGAHPDQWVVFAPVWFAQETTTTMNANTRADAQVQQSAMIQEQVQTRVDEA
ncbi:MAG TPA: lysophospholipid acyltransferase family protein [Ktedonobacteraceae bacterium]|nr:lysophospholipid acyltransferase family protein [Ktedonobacteraceae bacterium]